MFGIVSRPCGDELVGISSSSGVRREMTGVTAGEEVQPSGGPSQQEGKGEEREDTVGKESVQLYKHRPREASSSSSDEEESESALSPCVFPKSSEVRTSFFSSSSSFPGRETAVNGVVALKDERKRRSANHIEVSWSEKKSTERREGDYQHQNRKASSSASSFSSAQVFSSSVSPHLLTSSSAVRMSCSRPNSPVKDAQASEQEEGNRGASTSSLSPGVCTAQTTHTDSTPHSSSLARNTTSGQERPDSSSFGVAAKTSSLPLPAPAVLSSPSSLETSQSSSSLYPVAASLPGGTGSRRLSLDSPSSLARLPYPSSSTFSSSSPSSGSSSTAADKQNSAVFLPFLSSSSSFSKEGPLTPRETASPVSSSSTTSTSFKSALSINPIGKLLQRFGETVSALKKTSPPPSSLCDQAQESALPSDRSRSGFAGVSRARCRGDSRPPECGDVEEEGQREREGGTFSGRESEQLLSQGREHSGQKRERRQEGRHVQNRSEFLSGEDECVKKRMEETSKARRSFSQTSAPYKIEEPGDSREERWDGSASATGGDKKTDDESSLVPRPYQHPFLSAARLPYMPGAYESSALSRHPVMHHNTLTLAGGGGGGRGFPYCPDDFLLASSSSASSPPPPPFPVESHRAHMLMLMELQRLRGEMLHLQLATAAASKPLPPPNIIIQNKTEVASTTESNLQNLSHRDDRENKSSPFLDWVSRFFSSRLNQLIALCSVGLGCYMLLEHWRHSWRMAQLRRRVDSNILLRGVQMLEETIGVRRPTTSSPSFF